MDNVRKTAAIIVAAGSGSRMGGDIPKQFMKLGSMTILERAVTAFEQSERIDEILLVVAKDYIAYCEKVFLRGERFHKVSQIICGGKERQDSVRAALEADHSAEIILIHDGARPFVSQTVIERVVRETMEKGAVVTATPVKDTIKTVQAGVFSGTPDRHTLYAVQTPQGFEKNLLLKAYEQAVADGYYGTDDAVLAERVGANVYVSQGDYHNIKITTKEDLLMGELILREIEHSPPRPRDRRNCGLRIGTGYDVHRLVEGRPCVLGGVTIPFAKGLLGHSDADVLLHALMDALLGAAALGDIGRLFPDSDAEFAGISSLELLKRVGRRLEREEMRVINVDVTLIAQRPKIAPYVEEMRRHIADALQIDIGQIGIKGTTTEKLGFCGRGEGIAAEAVALIEQIKNL